MNAVEKRGQTGKQGRRQQGITLLEMLISLSLSVLLLSSLFVLYYGAARGAASDQNRSAANQESRRITERLTRDFRLIGLMALQDVDGDSNDINRDVPGMAWSDSARADLEYANSYEIVFTGDVDDDGRTETVRYWINRDQQKLFQTVWEWSRDSTRWSAPTVRTVGTMIDYVMFGYFDRDGNSIPPGNPYPYGGYTLTAGERIRVTTIEITVVTRSPHDQNARAEFLYLRDGTYWYDTYERTVHQFMVRGRNLSLGA